MPTTLGEKAVGSIVTLNENGVPQNYIVVHQGNPDVGLYDSSCDGTWLLRQNIYADAQWNSTDNSTFITAIVNTNYLPDLISIYDVGIAGSIKTVKIPYCVGNGSSTVNSGSNGWECQLFLLGGYELGWTQVTNSNFPIDGNVLSYFQGTSTTDSKRISYLNNNPTAWFLRSQYTTATYNVFAVSTSGGINFRDPTLPYGIRPAMILPTTMTVNDDNSIQNPTITTGQVPVGSIVKVKENGVPVDYIVVNQGIPQNSPLYDESCNGTWLLRKDIYANAVWDAGNENAYGPSDVNTNYLPNTILPLYDSDFQNVIKQVKIPYVNGTGSSPVASGADGLSTKLFLLGGYEVGFSQSDSQLIPIDGTKLDYFLSGTGTDANNKRNAKLNENISMWMLRSPNTYDTNSIWRIAVDGYDTPFANISSGIRPAFILPTNLLIDSDNNILSQSFTITVPQVFMQGQPIPISWTPWTLSASGTITYTIERNTGSGWTQVATGLSATSYSDTAQSGWTSVQYQIAPVVDGTNAPSFQSAVIPGVADAVLAISGIDGNLGTLTSNVQYTVVSNTGNQISLTRTVNGAQVVTIQVDSGFSYSIPIADLPTGTGTIIITASVEDTSQEIQTATRTWTYYKTPINIPSTGGIAQLTQNGQNIWPVTVPDAVEAPVYLGGNLNAALNKLGQAALYTKIGSPKYSEVTVDLSKVKVGDEVQLPYNGKMVSHIVVHIGNPDPSMYDASCNGVWLLRKDCVAQGQWNNPRISTLNNSTIITTMQGYVVNYDSSVQTSIKTVKIPYCAGGGNSDINISDNGLQCQIFPLSGYEVGFTNQMPNLNELPIDGAILSYFENTALTDIKRIAKFNNIEAEWWLRSPNKSSPNYSFYVSTEGTTYYYNVNVSKAYRPAFIMPTTFSHTYFVDSNNNVHPSQEYTTGGSITDVFGYDVPICQYEVGSYVGTGTYGSGSPNSLTFSFEPKVVLITSGATNSMIKPVFNIFINGCQYGYGNLFLSSINAGSGTTGTNLNYIGYASSSVVFSNQGISWFNLNSDASYQLNAPGIPYNYIAIG